MPLTDVKCFQCGYIEEDIFSKNLPLINPPFCPLCKIPMKQIITRVNFNIVTSDLRWDMYQPAFKKYCNSKKQVMEEMKKRNYMLEEQGGKTLEWTPTDNKMDSLEKLRKEEGEGVVNKVYKEGYENQCEKRSKEEYGKLLSDFSSLDT